MGIGGTVEYGQRAVPWEPERDLLLLFTDGLSDGLVEGSRKAGEERVVKEAARLRESPVRDVVRALFDLQRGAAGRGEGRPDGRRAESLAACQSGCA